MQNARILIVDDTLPNRIFIKGVLAPLDYELTDVESGEEALGLLNEQDFDMILLDIEMPGMDGFELAKKIHQNKKTAHIPIIFITKFEDNKAHTDRAFALGAIEYISRPFSPEALIDKIKLLLRFQALQKEVTKLRQFEAIKQMIVTYNHEFNNPLAILVGNLERIKRENSSNDSLVLFEKMDHAVDRIQGIISKISDLRNYEESNYTSDSSMVSLGNDDKKAG